MLLTISKLRISESMAFVRACMLALVFGLGGMLVAQGLSATDSRVVATCGAAPVVSRDSQPNIFSEEQEGWLGQIEADITESGVRPVRDVALNAHLQEIVDRLIAVLPQTKLKFRVILIESDEVNGFSIAGGHIYITRKLAAIAKSDDELAGVLGHEIGHIISHQFAFETTAELKRLTNVTSLGDEADVRAKYMAMLDAEYHDKHPNLKETDRDQNEADRIGLYAAAAAGYRPQAIAEFWNRVFFVEGKTGSRLGDLLGLTKPSEKRLRTISAMVTATSPSCGKGVTPDESAFGQWHEAVVANQAGTEVERSKALSEVTLAIPLRMELDQIRFSPDGKTILAQDQSSIFVIAREPLALRYRIDADGALPANFSPDSQSITFNTAGLHIEQWSVQDKKLLAAHEMLPKTPCYETRLSPDGRTLLCVEFDLEEYQLGLAMLDTTSSAVLWEKKSWLVPSYELAFSLLISQAVRASAPVFISSYSADGNTLLFAGGDVKTAFDLKQRAVIKTGGDIRNSITGDYAFLGNDKMLGVNLFEPTKSGLYSFPDGALYRKVSMPFHDVRSVSHPGTNLHVLAYGTKDYAVGLIDLSAGNVLMMLKTKALDEDDGVVAGEAEGGAIAFAHLPPSDVPQKHVELPLSPLPHYPVSAMSKDGKYLALSIGRRGGLWELSSGKRVGSLSGFTDAVWTDDDRLYLDVPKVEDVERHIAEVTMATRGLKSMPYKVDDETHMRYGRLTDWKEDKKKKSWVLSLHDPANDNVIWSKNFPDRYFNYTASYGDRDLIFNFQMNSHTAKEALKADAKLVGEQQAIKRKDSARLIEVLDGKTGEAGGSVVVELPPNYAGTDGINRAGDLLYVAGVDDRTAVYSMATGKQVRELVGYVITLDAGTGRVFTANRVGEGMVYGADGVELAHYQVGDPIRFALFREGATLVTILTADQKVRTMQVGVGGDAEKKSVKAEAVPAK